MESLIYFGIFATMFAFLIFYVTKQKEKKEINEEKIMQKTNLIIIGIFIINIILITFYYSPYTFIFWIIAISFIFVSIPLKFLIADVFKLKYPLKKFIQKNLKLEIIIIGIFAIFSIFKFITSPIFNAKNYASLIKPEQVKYKDYFVNNFNKLRKVTEKMALVKANKIFGKNIDGVDLTTQYELGKGSIIKYHNHEYWLFPLYYAGFFQWLSNDNVKGYILVDAINPTAQPQFIKYEYKYSLGAFFTSRNPYYRLYAYSGFRKIEIHPELDEKGNLYWVGQVLKYKYYGNVFYVDKILILNAKTGKIKEYNLNNVPKWLDKVYPQDIIQDYIEYYGKYKDGFMNALFVKKNVAVPTLYKNKEIYLIENTKNPNLNWYTGMTSVNSKDNALLYSIAVDAKTLQAYKIDNLNGITDEQGAISAVESKLGANSVRWKAVLPMPINYNNKFYYHTSVVDKNTNLYIKSAIVDGSNISNVEFLNFAKKININKLIKQNKIISKEDKIKIIIKRIDKIQKELTNLKIELKNLSKEKQ